MLEGGLPEERGADERAGREREGLLRLGERRLLGAGLALAAGEPGQVDDVERDARLGPDDLGDPALHLVERRAEDLVSRREPLQRAVERGDVERSRQAERERHVERRVSRQQLVQLPVAPLCQRRRENEDFVVRCAHGTSKSMPGAGLRRWVAGSPGAE